MKHNELLAQINKYCENIISGQIWTTDVFIKALRAVVELHHLDYGLPNEDVVCDFCKVVYPCPTIQAIEKSLDTTHLVEPTNSTSDTTTTDTCDECGNDLPAEGQSKCLDCLEKAMLVSKP